MLTEYRYVRAEVPEELLTCAALPSVAPAELKSQKDAAKYIERAKAVVYDCKGNLEAIKQILAEYNLTVDQITREKKK